jgi:hypothetical protein
MADETLLQKANVARFIALKTGDEYHEALANVYIARFKASCFLPDEKPILEILEQIKALGDAMMGGVAHERDRHSPLERKNRGGFA